MKQAPRAQSTASVAAPRLDTEGLPQVGNTLTVELAAVRCAAIDADLTTNGQKALAVTVHTMATDLLLHYSNLKSPCDAKFVDSRVAGSITKKDTLASPAGISLDRDQAAQFLANVVDQESDIAAGADHAGKGTACHRLAGGGR